MSTMLDDHRRVDILSFQNNFCCDLTACDIVTVASWS